MLANAEQKLEGTIQYAYITAGKNE